MAPALLAPVLSRDLSPPLDLALALGLALLVAPALLALAPNLGLSLLVAPALQAPALSRDL